MFTRRRYAQLDTTKPVCNTDSFLDPHMADLRPTVERLIVSIELLIKHLQKRDEIAGIGIGDYLPTRTLVQVAKTKLAQYELSIPTRDELAELVYEESIRGLARESFYPTWDELPDSLCAQVAYITADKILARFGFGDQQS